jgi:hypothetical protein
MEAFLRARWGAPTQDAFGRHRVSEPYTLWDSKLLGDNRALFWDDVEASGGGTSSTYTANYSSVALAVTADTAGKRVRQTKQRFNYQPGKSQLVFITGTLGAGADGITRRIGYFDDKDGVFFELEGSTLSVVRRSYRTGEVVDTKVGKTEWSLARLTGTDEVFNTAKSQIFVFDLEWLGVGSVRAGVVRNGSVIYLHQFDHANIGEGVYMTTPNLPIRYEIENDGTAEAASLECICSSVMSEGGQQLTGATIGLTTVPTHVDANAADTSYAVIGIKLKAANYHNIVKVRKLQLLNEANADFAWSLRLNPTVAGTFTYGDVTNAPIQAAYGATANTITDGTVLACGLSTASSVAADVIDNLLYLGSTIGGTMDAIVLCVTPLSANADIQGTMTIEFQ